MSRRSGLLSGRWRILAVVIAALLAMSVPLLRAHPRLQAAGLQQAGCTERVVNGGFENGTDSAPWVEVSPYELMDNGGQAHSGQWYAWLGRENNLEERLYQDVTIPADTVWAQLTYWWKVQSDERIPAPPRDVLTVTIRDTSNNLLQTLELISNASTRDTYVQSAFDLSGYAGQTIRVHFHSQTNPALITSFYIDDVSLEACNATPTPTPTPTTATPISGQVTIDKGVSPSTVNTPGQVVTYTYVITIANAGPSTVHVEQITDTLPSGFSYITTTGTSRIRYPDYISVNGQTVTWSYYPPPPSIGGGDYATLTFLAVSSNDGGTYCNRAGVTIRGSIGVVARDNLACVQIAWPEYVVTAQAGSRLIRAHLRLVNGLPVIVSWEILR